MRDCLTPTQQFFSYIMARTKNIKIKAETVMFLHSLCGKCINLWKKVQKKHCIKIPIVLKDFKSQQIGNYMESNLILTISTLQQRSNFCGLTKLR
jgi:hypothetical protein